MYTSTLRSNPLYFSLYKAGFTKENSRPLFKPIRRHWNISFSTHTVMLQWDPDGPHFWWGRNQKQPPPHPRKRKPQAQCARLENKRHVDQPAADPGGRQSQGNANQATKSQPAPPLQPETASTPPAPGHRLNFGYRSASASPMRAVCAAISCSAWRISGRCRTISAGIPTTSSTDPRGMGRVFDHRRWPRQS